MDKKMLAFLTLAIVVIVSCSLGIRAKGEESRFTDITDDYYKSIEQDFMDGVRERLDDNGFYNAGISLTKTLEVDGTLEYTVSIHHRRIDRMSQYQREQLSDIIIVDDIAIENSSVAVKYIEY